MLDHGGSPNHQHAAQSFVAGSRDTAEPGGGRHPKTSVRRDTSPDRRAAASPFAAMTGLGRDTSRLPYKTSVCRAGRSAPSQCEMVTGAGSSSPNQPDQERTTAYRDSSGPDSRSDAHCAIIVGDWEEPSGESRLKSLMLVPIMRPILPLRGRQLPKSWGSTMPQQ
jgi:hypothetical protein